MVVKVSAICAAFVAFGSAIQWIIDAGDWHVAVFWAVIAFCWGIVLIEMIRKPVEEW